MAVSAARSRRTVFVRIVEQANGSSAPLKVDKGVIYDVKVLGWTSPNSHGMNGAKSTRYTREAAQKALPLYEGATVAFNHPGPRDASRNREFDEAFGVLRNVRLTEDGIRADLHYYESDPRAGKLLEDVKRGMNNFALSHNATGRGEVRDGVYVIEEITDVASVDIVLNAATNTSLRESRHMAKKRTTLKVFLEGIESKFDGAKRERVKKLLEMDDYGGDSAMEIDDAEPSDPDQALADGFEAAIINVFRGDGTDQEKAAKIKKLLKAHESTKEDAGGGGEGEETDAEESEDDEETDTEESECEDDMNKGKNAKESLDLKKRLDELEAKDACRELCESLDFTPTKDQLNSLMECRSPEARKTVANAFKASRQTQESTGGRRQSPRSAPPGGGNGSGKKLTESKIPDDPKALANWLRG